MARRSRCANLALKSLALTRVSVNAAKPMPRAGHVSISITSDIQTGGNDGVDKDHPLGFELTLEAVGGKGQDRKDKSASAMDRTFEATATMLGTFSVAGDSVVDLSELEECYAWLAPQVYLPLRDYLQYTLAQIGVPIALPVSLPPTLNKPTKPT